MSTVVRQSVTRIKNAEKEIGGLYQLIENLEASKRLLTQNTIHTNQLDGRVSLKAVISQYFKRDDLAGVFWDVGLDELYEDLPDNATKSTMIQTLIDAVEDRGLWDALEGNLERKRPFLLWGEIISQAKQ